MTNINTVDGLISKFGRENLETLIFANAKITEDIYSIIVSGFGMQFHCERTCEKIAEYLLSGKSLFELNVRPAALFPYEKECKQNIFISALFGFYERFMKHSDGGDNFIVKLAAARGNIAEKKQIILHLAANDKNSELRDAFAENNNMDLFCACADSLDLQYYISYLLHGDRAAATKIIEVLGGKIPALKLFIRNQEFHYRGKAIAEMMQFMNLGRDDAAIIYWDVIENGKIQYFYDSLSVIIGNCLEINANLRPVTNGLQLPMT